MFEGPVMGNIPEVLDNGADGTRVAAGQLALALTPYAQVADLAVNTAASGNNAAAIQSLVLTCPTALRTGPENWFVQPRSILADGCGFAPAIAPLATAAALAGRWPRMEAASQINATLATAAANYDLKTVVDQHSQDIVEDHAAGGEHLSLGASAARCPADRRGPSWQCSQEVEVV